MADKSNVPYDTMSTNSVSTESIFSKCCCCIPLRTGCFILGYFNLVMNCLQTLALIAMAAFVGTVTIFDHFDSSSEKFSIYGTTESYQTTDSPDQNLADQSVLTQLGLVMVLLIIANVSWIIINIICLVGLHKKNPGPIRVYVGFAMARFILSLPIFLYLLINAQDPLHTVAYCIDLGLTAYFILVYYIYANKLEKEREAKIFQDASVNNVYVYPTQIDKIHLVA